MCIHIHIHIHIHIMTDQNREIDITGVVLSPGQPNRCAGNGATKDAQGALIECCCDECDHFLKCFPMEIERG